MRYMRGVGASFQTHIYNKHTGSQGSNIMIVGEYIYVFPETERGGPLTFTVPPLIHLSGSIDCCIYQFYTTFEDALWDM